MTWRGRARLGILVLVALAVATLAFAGGGKEKAAGPQTVTFITLDVVNFRPQLEIFIDEFMKANPNIKIDPVWSSDPEPQVITGLESGAEQDVTFIWSPALVPYVRQKKLAQLPAEFEKKVRDTVFDYALRPVTNEGKLYGVPYNYYPSFGSIMYNVDLWKQAGLDPAAAKTWDEFMAMCQKLTKRDATGRMTQAGFSAERDKDAYFYAFVFQGGGKIFNADGTAAFDNAIGRAALQRIVDVYTKWKVDDPEFGLTTDNFKQGTVAATNGMPWFASILAKDTPNIKFGFVPQPAVSSSPRNWGLIEVWMHGISKRAEGNPAVWQFVDYLLQAKQMSRWSAFSGEMPANKDAAKATEVTSSPFLGPFVDLMPYGKAEGLIEHITGDVSVLLRETMPGKVIRGMQTVDEAIREAATEINRLAGK